MGVLHVQYADNSLLRRKGEAEHRLRFALAKIRVVCDVGIDLVEDANLRPSRQVDDAARIYGRCGHNVSLVVMCEQNLVYPQRSGYKSTELS